MRILVLIAVTLTMGACGGSQKRSSDLLYDVRAYNEGVRWVKRPQAAVRSLPSEREAFLDELVTWRELGYLFSFHRDDYAKYDSLPDWARSSPSTWRITVVLPAPFLPISPSTEPSSI